MTRLIALTIAALTTTALLWLVVTLAHDATATETINATDTTTTTWASDPAPIPDLGPRFPELIEATRPEPRPLARTAPTRRNLFIAAYATEVVDRIRAGFTRFGPAVADQAVRVSSCETGGTFDPAARNGMHVGLFQLAERYHRARAERLGYTWTQVATEVAANVAVAADLYAEQGWTPWTCRWAA